MSNPLGGQWADRLEERFPKFLQYNYVGDPISWVFSHPAFTLCAAAVGWVIGRSPGAILAAFGMVGFYLVRETFDAVHYYREVGMAGAWKRLERNPYSSGVQVGWLADAIGDVVGPLCVALLLWWLL